MTASARGSTGTPVTVEEILRLIEEGASPASLEPLIARLPIDDQEKSRLWLRAASARARHAGPGRVPGLYLG